MDQNNKLKLDNAAVQFLKAVAETPKIPLDQLSVQDVRNTAKLLAKNFGTGPEIGEIKDQEIKYSKGTFDIRILKPKGPPTAIIVYYHGGGWVIGDIDSYLSFSRYLVHKSNAIVLMVNYRKAPEHPYPAAVEDAYESLLWANNFNKSNYNDALPLIVAGDSAGGNIAAVVSQLAREKNGPEITIQALVYPVTDYNLNTDSYINPDNQLFLTKEMMIWFWNQYEKNESKRTDSLLSPLRASSFVGLPPAVIFTAQFDPLRDEGVRYAQALINDGVTVIYRNYEDQFHNFFAMVEMIPKALDAIDFLAHSIQLLLNKNPKEN